MGEPTDWYLAFLTYFGMGAKRSVDAAYRNHTGEDEPIAPYEWWKKAHQWKWYERAALLDKEIEAEIEKAIEDACKEEPDEEDLCCADACPNSQTFFDVDVGYTVDVPVMIILL